MKSKHSLNNIGPTAFTKRAMVKSHRDVTEILNCRVHAISWQGTVQPGLSMGVGSRLKVPAS